MCWWPWQKLKICLGSSVPAAGPGVWPLSQTQDVLWWVPLHPLQSQWTADPTSGGRVSQGSGATSWAWPVTQTAVALPNRCLHGQVLWSVQEEQMFAVTVYALDKHSRLHPISPLRPEHVLLLLLSELLWQGSG